MIDCQSCKMKTAEIIESCDNENYPYRLCIGCHQRLINRALRPLEYFNLSAKHGRTYHLHDDFYEENGEACQPDSEFINDNSLAFPDFDSIKNNLENLIDYSIVLWRIKDSVIEEFQKFDKTEILISFKARLTENRSLDYRIYELTAKTLGNFAADWIRSEWENKDVYNLFNFSECLAKCLPIDEGFYYYTDELEKLDSPSLLSENLTGLIYFQSKLSLDWIEKNIKRVTNISNSWGYLAVASGFDWDRAKKWLDLGRPLSLVSLDSLVNCSVTKETLNSTLWLRDNPQRLLNPDTIDNMNSVLSDYLSKDNVTRVRNNINFITQNWDKILKTNN
jgi:hypothetical protein